MTFQALLAKPLRVAEVKRLVDTELARIVQFVSPVMVYLFGSAARGDDSERFRLSGRCFR